jgi:gentisate 1,2-dioxygenase
MYQRRIGSEQIGEGRSVKEEREEVFWEERDCRERDSARGVVPIRNDRESRVYPYPPCFSYQWEIKELRGYGVYQGETKELEESEEWLVSSGEGTPTRGVFS